jgi:hypothetical protein
MHMKLLEVESLARGNERQKLAYETLKQLDLFSRLERFAPLLVGAIPLGVELETSSLEIVCSAENLEEFGHFITASLSVLADFYIEHKLVRDRPAVLVSFKADTFAIRILAQEISSFTQNSVVQMLLEARLLAFAPKEVREEIRTLKRQGLSTEDAFVRCFDLDMVLNKEASAEVDSGAMILKAARMPDHEILMLAHRYRFKPQ